MTTKHLTLEEQTFLEALYKDNKIRGDKSFLAVMFWSGDNSAIYDNIEEIFGGYREMEIIKKSTLLFDCIEGMYIGKYESVFWATASEGELFSITTILHQLPYHIIRQLYSYPENIEHFIEKVQIIHGVNYSQYVEDYKVFCKQLGLEYIEEIEQPSHITKAFDDLVESIKS